MMLGHTHLVMGTAAALAILPPKDLPTLVLGLGVSALGGLLPDIDVGTSDSHKKADFITGIAGIIAAAVIIADWFFNAGIKDSLMANENLLKIIIPIMIFIAVCAYGKGTKHRTFMHSIMGLVIFTACVGMAIPSAAAYFFIGYASHIILDTLNKKEVDIFFPLKKGVAFRICKANGLVNRILFFVGTAVTVMCVSFSLWNAVAGNLSFLHF